MSHPGPSSPSAPRVEAERRPAQTVVSTSLNAGYPEGVRARTLADRWGLDVVPPDALPPDAPALIVARDGLILRHQGRDRRWHEGMIHALRSAGAKHPIVRLAGLQPGHTVLDTTLGLGTDARFLAEWTGTRVVGVEVVGILAEMAREGLERVGADVEVRVGDAREILAATPDDAFDLVLADPMFPHHPDGRAVGPSLEAVRWAADASSLDEAFRDEALRVARRAFVVRDVRGNDLLERLGAPVRYGKSGRSARYGCWRLDAIS